LSLAPFYDHFRGLTLKLDSSSTARITMSFKFGIAGPKKASIAKPKKLSTAFGFGDEDDDLTESLPTTQKGLKISQYGDLSTQQTYRKNVDKALEVDASIYDYDAAWDSIKAKEEARKAAEKEEAAEGKAKYMENLLVAKEQRDKDFSRYKEKKYQREREAEGDDFAEKEKFVTSAYKEHQEELRRQEQVEKKKEDFEQKKRENHGKQDFMKKLLQQGDERHQQAVEAAAIGLKHDLVDSEVTTKKSETDIAKELNAKGANIAFTDDGEVADKRDLLAAGLNVMGNPKAAPPKLKPASSQNHKNPLTARERQTKNLEDQLLQKLMKRQADDDSEGSREQEHVAKVQKSARDEAKERYLQRKKAVAGEIGQDSSTV
jgi:coiled-coil domain-containing protein 55